MANLDPLRFLIDNGKAWIVTQRATYRPQAQSLPDAMRSRFSPFFTTGILDAARVHLIPEIQNPPFYAQLAAAGQPLPLDFRKMHGITFIDTVFVATSKVAAQHYEALMFHECVHMVQYALLGVDQFVEQYVMGWAMNGRQYERIPMEVEAYALQNAFTANPGAPFSVEAAVRRRLGL